MRNDKLGSLDDRLLRTEDVNIDNSCTTMLLDSGAEFEFECSTDPCKIPDGALPIDGCSTVQETTPFDIPPWRGLPYI